MACTDINFIQDPQETLSTPVRFPGIKVKTIDRVFKPYLFHIDDSYVVRYKPETDITEVWQALVLGYDCVQINVKVNLVENDLKTPTCSLVIQGKLRGDGYCNFPLGTQISSYLWHDVKNTNGSLPIIQNIQLHSPEYPLRECPWLNIYTVTFPTSEASFSILHYENDKLRRIMVQNEFVY